ncbi:MAG: hypothetical protein FJZ67_10860, partial [Bacteroidetes bacterium]|nr:hypothetical protein [Bacteroidota bacterium]
KRTKEENKPAEIVPLKPMQYSSMVILAWAKAVEGNIELQNWLKDNGYIELYLSVFAIYLKDEPRDWLVKNGYAHLMAMINAAEGNTNAAKWLLEHNFIMLYHLARAVDHEDDSWMWLKLNSTQDIFILAQSIQKIKDEIEDNHNDIHSFNKDI